VHHKVWRSVNFASKLVTVLRTGLWLNPDLRKERETFRQNVREESVGVISRSYDKTSRKRLFRARWSQSGLGRKNNAAWVDSLAKTLSREITLWTFQSTAELESHLVPCPVNGNMLRFNACLWKNLCLYILASIIIYVFDIAERSWFLQFYAELILPPP